MMTPSNDAPTGVSVRVWDLPTRLFHWLLAASVVGLGDARIMAAVERWRAKQTSAVAKAPKDEPAK